MIILFFVLQTEQHLIWVAKSHLKLTRPQGTKISRQPTPTHQQTYFINNHLFEESHLFA